VHRYPGDHQADAGQVTQRRDLVRHDQADHGRGGRQQREG
jgi:hypothetical protein